MSCSNIPQEGVLFPGQPNSAFVDVTIKPHVFTNPVLLNQLKSTIAATPIRTNPPYNGLPSDSILDYAGRLSQTLPSNDFAVVFGIATERFEAFMGKPPPPGTSNYQTRVSMDGKHKFPAVGGDISFHIKSGTEAEAKQSMDQMIAIIKEKLCNFVAVEKRDIVVLKSFNGTSGRNQFGFFDAGSNPKVTANPILAHGPKINAYPNADATLDINQVPKGLSDVYTAKELFESLEKKERDAKASKQGRSSFPDMGQYATTFIDRGNHTGGSFQIWQKWIHNGLDEFKKLPVKEQSAVFGRERDSGKFIQDNTDPLNGGINKAYPNAHIVRAHIRMTDTENETADVNPLVQNSPGASLAPLQINRQASSFIGKDETGKEVKGLNFIAYAKDTKRFDQILDRMIGINMTWPLPRNSHTTDSLLEYSTAVTGKYYYIPSVTELEEMSYQGPKEQYDVVIVGGGVSGLYSAMTLKENNPSLNVAVFEHANFLGGRLVSIQAPETPIVCEFGGMRIPSNKSRNSKKVSSLFPYTNTMIEQLGLDTVPFPVDKNENPATVRGRIATQGDLKAPKTANGLGAKQLFHMPNVSNSELESGMYPSLLKQLGYDLVARKFDATNPLKMKELRVYLMSVWVDNTTGQLAKANAPGAIPLHQLSILTLWLKVYGMEAFTYQRFAAAYYSPFGNWNAVDALVDNLSDFVEGVDYIKVKAGYNTLVTSMAERYTHLGGELFMNQTLDSFYYGEHGFELSFNETSVNAEKLILAMPGGSLKRIESPLLRQPSVVALMETVSPRPFFKIFLVYENAWWNVEGEEPYTGRAITDLPAKQLYFWETDESGKAVVMVYDDGISPRVWSALTDRTPLDRGTNWDYNPSNIWEENKASDAMRLEAHRQFTNLFNNIPKDKMKEPISAAYAQWTDSSVFGGGVNFWMPGVDSQKVVKQMMNPIPAIPMYVTGSCYSNYQGWVEGALQVADDMLTKYFHVPSMLAGQTNAEDMLVELLKTQSPLQGDENDHNALNQELASKNLKIQELENRLASALATAAKYSSIPPVPLGENSTKVAKK